MRMNSQSAGKHLNDIINLYTEGLSERQIAKKLNITRYNVNKNLTLSTIVKRNSNRELKALFNENYFNLIDTEEKAYWLGFLAADGYVNIKEGYMRLELGAKDLQHLHKLCEALDYPRIRIRYRHTRGTYYLHISSKVFANTLVNLKESNLINTITEDLQKHFIRGFFDGDGSVFYRGKKGICTAIIANYETCINIQDCSKHKFSKLRHVKSCNMYRLCTDGINPSLKFLSYLYDNAKVYLDRKSIKYTDYIARCRFNDYHKSNL